MVRHGLKYAGLICHGEQNFFATKQRDGAAEQVLTEEYPEIRVCGKVNFLTEVDVYQKTLKLIGMYPEIQALYVSWDGPALEVIKALTELERTDIAIVTGDLDYAIAMQMAQGGMVKMISAQCPYEQGEAIAMVAANGLLGKSGPLLHRGGAHQHRPGEPAEKLEGDLQGGSAGGVAQRDQPQRRRTLTAVRRVQTDRQNIKRISIWKRAYPAFYIAPAQAGFPEFSLPLSPARLFGRVFLRGKENLRKYTRKNKKSRHLPTSNWPRQPDTGVKALQAKRKLDWKCLILFLVFGETNEFSQNCK